MSGGYGAKFGYLRDSESGFYLCTLRYYYPSAGRWITRDPTGASTVTYFHNFKWVALLLAFALSGCTLADSRRSVAFIIPSGYVWLDSRQIQHLWRSTTPNYKKKNISLAFLPMVCSKLLQSKKKVGEQILSTLWIKMG